MTKITVVRKYTRTAQDVWSDLEFLLILVDTENMCSPKENKCFSRQKLSCSSKKLCSLNELKVHCCYSIVAGAKQIFWGIFLHKISRGSNNYVVSHLSPIRPGASNSGLTQQERDETLDSVVRWVTRTAFGPLRYVSLKQ